MNTIDPNKAVLNQNNLPNMSNPSTKGLAPAEQVKVPSVLSQTLEDDSVKFSDAAMQLQNGGGTYETQGAGGTTLPGWPPKKPK